MLRLKKIISGGQTGVDRAAFDFALKHGIEIGGFVPKDRRAEDGRIPDRYPNLIETNTRNYAVRTELNVQNSDATLIISHGKLTGGSKLTKALAQKHGKPFLHLDLERLTITEEIQMTGEWLLSINCRELNVAGPRASTDPVIYQKALNFLEQLIAGK